MAEVISLVGSPEEITIDRLALRIVTLNAAIVILLERLVAAGAHIQEVPQPEDPAPPTK